MNYFKGIGIGLMLSGTIFMFGCPANTTVTTDNTNTGNIEVNAENTNMENTNSNMNSEENTTSAIDVKEPETYQGKVNMKLEATGNKAPGINLLAVVARKGANKRMEFSLPTGQKLIYLEIGSRNLVILPDTKQYAELNENSTGFAVRSLMTPGQMVNQIKNLKGVQKVGEEKVGERDAVKYTYGGATQTGTQAGEVDTDSYVLVDKETGLPLRTETVSQSDKEINGFKGLKIITEMTDIKMDVSDDLFKEPTDYKKVEEEQVRQQIGLIFNVVQTFITQMMQSGAANGN